MERARRRQSRKPLPLAAASSARAASASAQPTGKPESGGKGPLPYLGAWLVVWAAFTFVLWLATLKAGTRTLQLVFLTLWIAFLLLGLSHLLGEMEILHTIGGYVGGATALLAFYLASAEVLNEAHGKTVLKV